TATPSSAKSPRAAANTTGAASVRRRRPIRTAGAAPSAGILASVSFGSRDEFRRDIDDAFRAVHGASAQPPVSLRLADLFFSHKQPFRAVDERALPQRGLRLLQFELDLPETAEHRDRGLDDRLHIGQGRADDIVGADAGFDRRFHEGGIVRVDEYD